jgi:uncharacterized membrane protein
MKRRGERRVRPALPGRLGRSGRPDEEGSVLLLTLGYATLAIAVIFVCVDATSLYLAQKRLDALADAAALAGAETFDVVDEAGAPRARLSSDAVRAQAEALVADAGQDISVVDAGTPDTVSARVTLASTWRPPLTSMFVPGGVGLEATATSRTVLLSE